MFRKQLVLLVGLCLLSLGKTLLQNGGRGLDLTLRTPDFIRQYGYPVETHTVTTEDGYLLTVHRIPGSPRAPSSGVKTPVLLMHALLMASDVWVATGPEKGLGFLLADQGYDVWMGNSRGNLYSRRHVSMSPNQRNFWDFSWHEMGVYDLPAVIDHILKTTNHQQLSYVGYSMGTTMFFVLTSTRPEYNNKIRKMVALAPVVYDGQRGSVLEMIFTLVGNTHLTEIFPRTRTVNSIVNFACQNGRLIQGICSFIYFQIMGFNAKELNRVKLEEFDQRLLSMGTPTSLHISNVFGNIQSYIRTLSTDFRKGFQMLDRGARRRGSIAPMPEYNLTLVTAPVALIYAPNDAIARPKGVLRLSEELPNVTRVIRVADDAAAHGDFTFANNVKRLVYDDVIDLLRQ